MRTLLIVSGSVAAIKTEEIYRALLSLGEVKVIATKSAKYFMKKYNLGTPCHVDEDEWPDRYTLGDKILHIELSKWAECIVVAPLSANTLAKVACGITDNLATNTIRAFDWTKPILFAPAMNTYMWNNEPTAQQLKIIKDRGGIIIPPISKRLACNDVGIGAMAEISTIVGAVQNSMQWQFPLRRCAGIPINYHPGAFGFHRRRNWHPGVDLYTLDLVEVHAVESGTVVSIGDFTGPKLGHTWWEETMYVMIEGMTGVVNYGEITPLSTIHVGQYVAQNEHIGYVKRVLFPYKLRTDIDGHSTSMLHLELYTHGTKECTEWHSRKRPRNLLDPTPFLLRAKNAPPVLTWFNTRDCEVG